MISFKKRQQSSGSYDWRPNFRDYESLPDIRAVRTQFFLPTALVALALAFVGYLASREYRAVYLKSEISTIEAEISQHDVNHAEKVSQNAEFMSFERSLDEISAFLDDQLVGSDFLLAVSSRIMSGMYLTRVEYAPELVTIEGNLEVPAEEASRIVDGFLKALQEGDVVQGKLTEYKLTSLERDATSRLIRFRIQVEPKPDPKAKAKK